MLLDPESYIPVEVARGTELARNVYRSTPSRPLKSMQRSRFLAVLRLGRRPAPLA